MWLMGSGGWGCRIPTPMPNPPTHPPNTHKHLTFWLMKVSLAAGRLPDRILSASMTISPLTMALVEAMAWMMLPAMPCG